MPRHGTTKKGFCANGKAVAVAPALGLGNRAGGWRARCPGNPRGPLDPPPQMIVATGVDLVELARVRRLFAAKGERFLQRVCTQAEADYCRSLPAPVASIGARFAAKEAVMKCLGTGWAAGVRFAEVEVVRSVRGAVGVRLSGRAADLAQARGIARVHLSLSHTKDHAFAVAIAEA